MEYNGSVEAIRFPSFQFDDDLPLDDMLTLLDDFMLPEEPPFLDRHHNVSIPPAVVTPPPQTKAPKGRRPIGLKPKRIRRERREMLYLRQQVEDLGQTLTSLTVKSQKRARDHSERGAADAMTLATEAAVWKQLAKQHLRRRTTSETENKRLKAEVQELVQITSSLERILTAGAIKQIMSSIDCAPHTARASDCPSIFPIVEDQVLALEQAYLQLDAVLLASGFSRMPTMFFDVEVVQDADHRVVIEMKSQRELPYDLATTKKVLWKFFSGDCVSDQISANKAAIVSDYIVTRTVNDKEHQGQHTIRKYETEDRTAFIWKTRVNQATTFGHALSSLIETQGQQVLRSKAVETNCRHTSSTVVQMFCKITLDVPGACPGGSMPDKHSQAMSDMVLSIKKAYADMTAHMVDQLATEERWQQSKHNTSARSVPTS